MDDGGAQFGDTIIVEMQADPDPDNPEIPEELVHKLASYTCTAISIRVTRIA